MNTLGKIILSSFLFAILLYGGYLIVFAACCPFEGMEDYADEDALDTKSGGSNWSDAWVASTSVAVDSAQAQAGSLSVELRSGAVRQAYRTFTNAMDNDTTFKIWFRTANATLDAVFIYLSEGTGHRGSFDIASDGNVYQCTNDGDGCTGTVNLGAWAVNTWYCIQVEVDTTNDRYRGKLGTSCATPDGTFTNTFAAFTSIDTLFLRKASTANNVWLDSIGEPPTGGPPATLEDGWFMIF